MELVLLPATLRVEVIVAISAVEKILPLVFAGQKVASVALLEHIVALPANQKVVVIRSTVEDIAAGSSLEVVRATKAAYLALAVLTGK